MYWVGDLVEVTFTDPTRGQQKLQAIVVHVDPHLNAIHVKFKRLVTRPYVIVASSQMLRMVRPDFVAEDRREKRIYKVRVHRKMGWWWL